MYCLFFAISICLSYCNGQVLLPGKCPENVLPMKTFNPMRFLGRWFEIERYYSDLGVNGKCASVSFDGLPDGRVMLLHSAKHVKTGDSFAYVGYAVFDAGSLSKMNVDFSQDSANSGKVVPYWILDTDYDSYALVWSCLEVCEGYHAEMSSLLGRSSNISDEVTSRMFGLLENGGASTRRFQSVIHSNCEGHNHVQWLEKAKARFL